MVRFRKVSYCEIETLREQYFTAIYEAQELFLELIVKTADYYIIEQEEAVGYFIISPQNQLVEYYLINSCIKDCQSLFAKITIEFNFETVYCKSFDSILLKCCLKYAVSYKVIGTLFRDYTPTSVDVINDFDIKKAIDSDIPLLLQQTDELYESEDELFTMVKNGNILMYCRDSNLIGCGFLIKVIDNRNIYDIGMWVKSAFRKKGFATKIVAHLKGYCLDNSLIPICGCAADNLASRKTLEKNGFFSKHDLIEFQIK